MVKGSTMVKDVVVSKDRTTTCDKKRGKAGGAPPELTCRRCCQRVAISEAQAEAYKSQDVVDAHAKRQCSPPQVSWQYRPVAPAMKLATAIQEHLRSWLLNCVARVCGARVCGY